MANKNLFNSVALKQLPRNRFDLSHDVKMTLEMGYLCPVLCMDCVPGDKFNISCEALLRFAPLIAPVYHRIYMTFHYFFVPNRLLWKNWEDWIVNPQTTIVRPYFTMNSSNTHSQYALLDYMGLPPYNASFSHNVNALPLAAYQAIWNEYYRDQNLIPEFNYVLSDGANSLAGGLGAIRRRAWEHDYYTSALPFAQKGSAVTIPLAGFNDVPVNINLSSGGVPGDVSWPGTSSLGGTPTVEAQIDDTTSAGIPASALYAATSGLQATSSTIESLRRAFRLQEWLERAARGGTRYIEFIRAMFNVQSSDKRLQRPEYITGVRQAVTISEVLNTTGEQAGLPQGNMAGHAVGVTSGNSGSYFCEEHGWIIGIMSVLPTTSYEQGIPKMWLRDTPLDYYWEQFANIGEQEVKMREIFAGSGANGTQVFGYVPRYSEYKYFPSRVAGNFRKTTGTLGYWHFGRHFANQPALNQQFVEADVTKDPFAVVNPNEHSLYAHIYNKISASRQMPFYGQPKF